MVKGNETYQKNNVTARIARANSSGKISEFPIDVWSVVFEFFSLKDYVNLQSECKLNKAWKQWFEEELSSVKVIFDHDSELSENSMTNHAVSGEDFTENMFAWFSKYQNVHLKSWYLRHGNEAHFDFAKSSTKYIQNLCFRKIGDVQNPIDWSLFPNLMSVCIQSRVMSENLEVLIALLNSCHLVNFLKVGYCDFTAECMNALNQLPNLKTLHFAASGISSDFDLNLFVSLLRNVENLYFLPGWGFPNDWDNCVSSFAKLTKLKVCKGSARVIAFLSHLSPNLCDVRFGKEVMLMDLRDIESVSRNMRNADVYFPQLVVPTDDTNKFTSTFRKFRQRELSIESVEVLYELGCVDMIYGMDNLRKIDLKIQLIFEENVIGECKSFFDTLTTSCPKLEELRIPHGAMLDEFVSKIGTFKSFRKLGLYIFDADTSNTDFSLYPQLQNIPNIEIDSLTFIPRNLPKNCKNITSVRIRLIDSLINLNKQRFEVDQIAQYFPNIISLQVLETHEDTNATQLINIYEDILVDQFREVFAQCTKLRNVSMEYPTFVRRVHARSSFARYTTKESEISSHHHCHE